MKYVDLNSEESAESEKSIANEFIAAAARIVIICLDAEQPTRNHIKTKSRLVQLPHKSFADAKVKNAHSFAANMWTMKSECCS